MPDAGADDDDAGRWASGQPRIPWLEAGVPPIRIAPCPLGWREVHDDEVTTCDPYPEGGPEECAEGFAHFPGGPGCEPVGSPCPTGEWSDGLPTDGVLYVRAGAPAGGLGTRDAPFARIRDAMARATNGTIVALSRGLWDEAVSMKRGVTLQGACAAEAVLAPGVPPAHEGLDVDPVFFAPIVTGADGAQLRDVRIEASRRGIVVAGNSEEFRVEGVIVSGVLMYGIHVAYGARFTAARLVVRETQSRRDLQFGHGLWVESGASAELTNALFDRNRTVAVLVDGVGTSMRLEDVAVRDTRSQESDGRLGHGINVQHGASVQVARALFERNLANAILALNSDFGIDGVATSVRLEDIVVRDTQNRRSDGTFGGGSGSLVAALGANIDVSRALFERNRVFAIHAQEAASMHLRDVVVRDTLSREAGWQFDRGWQVDRTYGRGLNVVASASATVSRALFVRNREVAIFAAGMGTTLLLDDVAVSDTLAADCGNRCVRGAGGIGLGSYDVASLSASRFVVARAALCGAQIASGGQLDLSEGEVRESAIGACVQAPGYRLSRLNESVVYEANGADIEGTDFPVPEVYVPEGL